MIPPRPPPLCSSGTPPARRACEGLARYMMHHDTIAVATNHAGTGCTLLAEPPHHLLCEEQPPPTDPEAGRHGMSGGEAIPYGLRSHVQQCRDLGNGHRGVHGHSPSAVGWSVGGSTK
jgi:hypothetical protein